MDRIVNGARAARRAVVCGVAAVAMPLIVGAQAPAAAALPPAQAIIAKYVKAIGGRDAILAETSSHTTGTFAVPAAGLIGEVEVFAAKPNKMLVKTNFPQIGPSAQGFDGETAWSVDGMQGPMLLEGKQLEQMKVQADFYSRLHDPEAFASMETKELVDFEGKKAYRVHLVRKNGEEFDELYDAESGLLVGSVMTRDTPMGSVTVTSVLGDYKPFGGQLVPTKVVQKLNGQEIVVTIGSIEYGGVDPSTFDLPDQIKALKQTP